MVILALIHPELCLDRPPLEYMDRRSVTGIDRSSAYLRYLGILSGERGGEHGHREPVVLERYPVDPEMLRGDIRPIAAAIIERHGMEEWTAALIANEFHRHLGIYSLIGVKMGIRAREIMDAGIDDLRVISNSGSSPPLSCMCDGLQVATGASLGRGTISIDQEKSEASAVFIKGSRRLLLELKQDISGRISSDIEETIRKHGALTPAYWSGIRKLSLQYWLEMSRREIFDEAIDKNARK
jgi:pyrimidine-specific ribonucleoside hydrolase